MCEDTCDTAALVVSELVTNAIVHTASSHVVCELHDHEDLVRIAVRDEGCAPGDPHPSAGRPEEEHGRGLLLIDALCHAWGAQENGPGLLVWAELPRRSDPASDTAPPCNDLGWGARPKPTPSGGSGDEDEVDGCFGGMFGGGYGETPEVDHGDTGQVGYGETRRVPYDGPGPVVRFDGSGGTHHARSDDAHFDAPGLPHYDRAGKAHHDLTRGVAGGTGTEWV